MNASVLKSTTTALPAAAPLVAMLTRVAYATPTRHPPVLTRTALRTQVRQPTVLAARATRAGSAQLTMLAGIAPLARSPHPAVLAPVTLLAGVLLVAVATRVAHSATVFHLAMLTGVARLARSHEIPVHASRPASRHRVVTSRETQRLPIGNWQGGCKLAAYSSSSSFSSSPSFSVLTWRAGLVRLPGGGAPLSSVVRVKTGRRALAR